MKTIKLHTLVEILIVLSLCHIMLSIWISVNNSKNIEIIAQQLEMDKIDVEDIYIK